MLKVRRSGGNKRSCAHPLVWGVLRKQMDAEETALKRREQQAEHDRILEIHDERLQSSALDAQDPNTVCCQLP
jgi:hypothetical protein